MSMNNENYTYPCPCCGSETEPGEMLCGQDTRRCLAGCKWSHREGQHEDWAVGAWWMSGGSEHTSQVNDKYPKDSCLLHGDKDHHGAIVRDAIDEAVEAVHVAAGQDRRADDGDARVRWWMQAARHACTAKRLSEVNASKVLRKLAERADHTAVRAEVTTAAVLLEEEARKIDRATAPVPFDKSGFDGVEAVPRCPLCATDAIKDHAGEWRHPFHETCVNGGFATTWWETEPRSVEVEQREALRSRVGAVRQEARRRVQAAALEVWTARRRARELAGDVPENTKAEACQDSAVARLPAQRLGRGDVVVGEECKE